jgi:hypothetical protein
VSDPENEQDEGSVLEREAARLMPHHRGLALGATLTIVGLGFVGTHASEVGAFVVLAGLLLLFFQIHRYGRLGPAGTRG